MIEVWWTAADTVKIPDAIGGHRVGVFFSFFIWSVQAQKRALFSCLSIIDSILCGRNEVFKDVWQQQF